VETKHKYATIFLLLLLLSAIFMTLAYAQDETPEEQFPPTQPLPGPGQPQAYVIIAPAVGGTTNPAPGSYTYQNTTQFTITATPYSGYRFAYWVISGQYVPGHNLPAVIVPDPLPDDWIPKFPSPQTADWDSLITSQNPLNVICGYGYTYQYQPVFVPISAPTAQNNTVVVMLEAVGGTTDPLPGTYFHSAGEKLTIKATANEDYIFAYWVAKGPIDAIIVGNPADISCQENVAYTYQPVFFPHSAQAEPIGGTPVIYFYAAIIILAVIAVIAVAAALMYRSRAPKAGSPPQ
jgi:hypothetical protein